jgi:hypothetical protein
VCRHEEGLSSVYTEGVTSSGLLRTGRAGALAVLAAGLLCSCGGGQDEAVARAADDFVQALAQQDGDSACALLAPTTSEELEQSSGQPCSKAVLDEGVIDAGARVSVQAYGTMAQVRFAQDTVFLTRYQSGWRVLAAACAPPSSQGSFDCQLQGG